MADKLLSESSWKSFAKGKSYKDAALLKALVDVSRAEREPPEAQIKSLEALNKQADALLKLHKGDKELAGYMAEMGKAAERARKSAEQAKEQAKAAQKAAEKAAEKQAGKDDGDDDGDESAALLTTKLVPLLRLAMKGEPMHAMVASAGKAVAVLLSRKPIPTARRKVLAEQLEGGGSIKYFVGQCVREDGAVTFVLPAQVTGLAKRLKAALLAQTGLRVNQLRCRGEDGAIDHDSDEDAPPMVAQGDASSANAPAPWPNAAPLDKARTEWSQARQHAMAEIARLKALLGDAYRDAADEQEALAKALQRLDATIASMDDALSEQLDRLLSATPDERAGLASAARSTLERLLGFVTRDEILTKIDGNELAPEMKVAEPLHARLQAIAAALG